MKTKYLITILFFLTIGTKAFATQEETTHICYVADTLAGRSYMPIEHIEYLRPEIFYGGVPWDFESKGEFIMDWLADYNSVFEYVKVEAEKTHLSVFLRTMKLSEAEHQELIASLLLNGCKCVTIIFSNGTKRTYTKKDINMPFFIPVYFYDELLDDGLFVHNAIELLQIYKANDYKHIVEAGETIYGIAKQYGISQEELIKNNSEIENTPLQIGQELIIYQKKELETCDNQNDSKDESKNCNIVVWFLLGISILLNGWFIWKFYAKKK